VPVASAAQLQNVVSLHHSDEGVVTLEPVVATGVNPADVVSTVSRPALVRDNAHKLIIARVQAGVEGPVEHFVVLLDLFFFLRGLGSKPDQFLLLLCILAFLLHFNVLSLFLLLIASELCGVLGSSVGLLQFAALQQ